MDDWIVRDFYMDEVYFNLKHERMFGMFSVILYIVFSFMIVQAVNAQNILYSNKPAENWHEAFPLGNGRIGAMAYGGIFSERVQTNEDTFWAGGPRSLQKKGCLKYVERARKLIASGHTSEAEELINTKESEPSSQIRKRVVKARKMQAERYKHDGILTNSELSNKLIKKYCELSNKSLEMMQAAAKMYQLSGRKYNRILKLARTIADLDGSEKISESHISQAIQYK